MAKYIKPTLTLTSNASGASTDPGPLSIALSLSATDKLDVDTVRSSTVTFASATDHQLIVTGANEDIGSNVAGLNGGFLYLKNITSSDIDIYIGVEPDADGAADLATDGNVDRLFTLRQGEFAWMPFDYTRNVSIDAAGAATLEYWLFNRSNT